MIIMVILVGDQGAGDWGALQGCPTRTGGENLLDWIGTSRWDLVKCFPFGVPGILDILFSSFWISLEFPDEIFSNVFLSCLLSLLSRDCRVCCSKPTKIWIMWTRWRIWSPAAPTPTPPLKVPITVMSPSLLEIVSVTLVCNLSKIQKVVQVPMQLSCALSGTSSKRLIGKRCQPIILLWMLFAKGTIYFVQVMIYILQIFVCPCYLCINSWKILLDTWGNDETSLCVWWWGIS